MAWIEQTKKGSRKSGGPQYYLQGLGEAAKAILERRGQVNVALWTPYGPVCEGLVAVSRQVGLSVMIVFKTQPEVDLLPTE
jgi:hypothetical protein